MITFENVKFDAQGANKKDSVFALTLSGKEDVEIKNCEFANMGYSAIKNDCAGSVRVADCVFNCENVYNPIEGSQSVRTGNLSVEGCEFKGAPGNNYCNTYSTKEDAIITIKGCSFEPTVDNNIVRISNRTNAKVTVNVSDSEYNYAEGEPTEYTAFLICQDYTNKNGVKQDFTGCTVTFNNVKCNGEVLTADSERIFYVYEDGKGIITGEGNDPIIKFN